VAFFLITAYFLLTSPPRPPPRVQSSPGDPGLLKAGPASLDERLPLFPAPCAISSYFFLPTFYCLLLTDFASSRPRVYIRCGLAFFVACPERSRGAFSARTIFWRPIFYSTKVHRAGAKDTCFTQI